MQGRSISAAAAAAVLALSAGAGSALGFGDTPQGHAIGDAFRTVVETRGADGRLGRRIRRAFRALDRVTNERLAAREMAAAARAARFAERSLPDEAVLEARFGDAVQAYLDDLEEVLDTLLRAGASDALPEHSRRRAERARRRLERLLPAPGDLSTLPASESLRRIARAAAAVRGYAAYDGETLHFLTDSVSAPAGEIDFDGDGAPDATTDLSALGIDLADLVTRYSLRMGERPTFVLWNVDDAADDAFVSTGYLAVLGNRIARKDADARRHPLLRDVGALRRGAFTFSARDDALRFGMVQIHEIALAGRISESLVVASNLRLDGTVALAIPRNDVLALIQLDIDTNGLPVTVDQTFLTALDAALDHDVDRDGTDDSVTVVLEVGAPAEPHVDFPPAE